MERLLHGRRAATPRCPGRHGHQAALQQLWQLAYREASTLAFADAFRAIMLAFMVATLLVPCMRKVAHPGGHRPRTDPDYPASWARACEVEVRCAPVLHG